MNENLSFKSIRPRLANWHLGMEYNIRVRSQGNGYMYARNFDERMDKVIEASAANTVENRHLLICLLEGRW